MSRFTIRISPGEAPADARAIRRKVFVEEQGVASDEEWDEHDAAGAATLHFVALENGRAVGCARLRAHGEGAKLERVAVLHAQTAVIPFYERLGWRAQGPEFDEAGIPHRKMERRRRANRRLPRI
jgi:ElaA protein